MCAWLTLELRTNSFFPLSSLPDCLLSDPHKKYMTLFLLLFGVSLFSSCPLSTTKLSAHSRWFHCWVLFYSQALFSYCQSICWPLTTVHPFFWSSITVQRQSRDTPSPRLIDWFFSFSSSFSRSFFKFLNWASSSGSTAKQEWSCM